MVFKSSTTESPKTSISSLVMLFVQISCLGQFKMNEKMFGEALGKKRTKCHLSITSVTLVAAKG